MQKYAALYLFSTNYSNVITKLYLWQFFFTKCFDIIISNTKPNWFSQNSSISREDFCDVITLPIFRQNSLFLTTLSYNEKQQQKRQMYNSQSFTQVSKTPRTNNFSTLYAWTQKIITVDACCVASRYVTRVSKMAD